MKNFFVAVFENKLVVELINNGLTITIDAKHISDIFNEQIKKDKGLLPYYQLFEAYINPDEGGHKKITIIDDEDVEIYIKSSPDFSKIVANFRSSGMLVGTNNRRRFYQHYAVVVIIRGKKLGGLLGQAEPPRHNRWDHKLISESTEEGKENRKIVKKCISDIDSKVIELLYQQFKCNVDDSIDSGVSDYLPDKDDPLMQDKGAGEDILRPKVKVGAERKKNVLEYKQNESGKHGEGKKEDMLFHNQKVNPDPHPLPPVPPVVVPDNKNKTLGIVPGKGSKIIQHPVVLSQRAFPLNYQSGIYKIVAKFKYDNDNVFVKCFAVGEDGTEDFLTMKTLTYNNRKINIVDGQAGPVHVHANEPVVFFVTFEQQEKMLINVLFSGGRDK